MAGLLLVGSREVIAIALGALVAGVLWLVLVEDVLPGQETAEFAKPLGELARGDIASEARDCSVWLGIPSGRPASG